MLFKFAKSSPALSVNAFKRFIAPASALVLLASSFAVLAPDASAQTSTQPIKGQAQKVQVIDYPDAQADAQAIVNRVESANRLSPDTVQQIRVVKAEDLNAATDGQQIMVSSALWNLLKTDDQRAFVISHEMSHIVLHHIAKTQVRQVGLGLLNYFLLRNVSTQNTFSSQLTQVAAAAGMSLVDNKFSRTAEYQADDKGLQLMKQAGYNPKAALEVFEIFEQNVPNSTPEFLQNHPLNKSRIQALVQKYNVH